MREQLGELRSGIKTYEQNVTNLGRDARDVAAITYSFKCVFGTRRALPIPVNVFLGHGGNNPLL